MTVLSVSFAGVVVVVAVVGASPHGFPGVRAAQLNGGDRGCRQRPHLRAVDVLCEGCPYPGMAPVQLAALCDLTGLALLPALTSLVPAVF